MRMNFIFGIYLLICVNISGVTETIVGQQHFEFVKDVLQKDILIPKHQVDSEDLNCIATRIFEIAKNRAVLEELIKNIENVQNESYNELILNSEEDDGLPTLGSARGYGCCGRRSCEVENSLEQIKTILVNCCQDISNELSVIEIAIANLSFSTTVTVVINELTNTLTVCCTNLLLTITSNFVNTNNIINNNFAGTFTTLNVFNNTLTTCCSDILSAIANLSFSISATAISNLNDTLTVCCADLKLTITQGFSNTNNIINNNFAGTFTVINDIKDTLTACCLDLKSTITSCCDAILSAVNNLSFLLSGTIGGCSGLSIGQAEVNAAGGTFIISTPGNYNLREDILVSLTAADYVIVIDSSDTTLNLCGKAIQGIPNILYGGVRVGPGLKNIKITNGQIRDFDGFGIKVDPLVEELTLDSISTFSIGIAGILFNDPTIITPEVSNCYLFNCQTINCGYNSSLFGSRFTLNITGGLACINCANFQIYKSNFSQCRGDTIFGAALTLCKNFLVKDCNFSQNQGSFRGIGLNLFGNSNSKFYNCLFNENSSTSPITRFTVGGTAGVSCAGGFQNLFYNCQACENQGDECAGFEFSSGTNNRLEDCVANFNRGSNGGIIFDTESNAVVINCQANGNDSTNSIADTISGIAFQSGLRNSIISSVANSNLANNEASGIKLIEETNTTVLKCLCDGNASTTGVAAGILLDADTTIGTSCTNCFIRSNEVANTFAAGSAFGYIDRASSGAAPFSSSLFASNMAFNNALGAGSNYSVVYPFGPLPTVTGSLTGGLPATNTTGSFDNIDINL